MIPHLFSFYRIFCTNGSGGLRCPRVVIFFILRSGQSGRERVDTPTAVAERATARACGPHRFIVARALLLHPAGSLLRVGSGFRAGSGTAARWAEIFANEVLLYGLVRTCQDILGQTWRSATESALLRFGRCEDGRPCAATETVDSVIGGCTPPQARLQRHHSFRGQ